MPQAATFVVYETVALFGVSRLAPRLMTRFGAKPLMVAGLASAVGGLAWLGQISPATTYWPGVLGPMLLMGCGMGLAFVPLTAASLTGVAPEDSGSASAMVNVTQQVGGALGLAALVTVYGHAARTAQVGSVGAGPLTRAQDILAHGVAASFATAALFDVFAIGVIIAAVRLGTTAVKAR